MDAAILIGNLMHGNAYTLGRLLAPTFSFFLALHGFDLGIDALFHNIAGAKYQYAARGNRHFLTGFRIPTDPLPLFPDTEAAKRGQLYRFAASQCRRDFLQDHLDQFRRFMSRQSNFFNNCLDQVGSCQCFLTQCSIASPHLVQTMVTRLLLISQ